MAEAVYLDACLLIYLVEEDPVFGDRVANALRARDPRQLAVSPLVRMEVLVKPIRIADLPLQRRDEQALDALTLLDMPAEVYDAAAVLRASSGCARMHCMACAQHHGCQAL
jgi:predicted nucleic acid-binding protein